MRSKRQQAMAGLATVIGAGLLVATAATAPAVAADYGPAAGPQTRSAEGIRAVYVSTWINGNVRTGPSTNFEISYPVPAGWVGWATCWKYGGWVTANGISHDKWVKLSNDAWIWGGLLTGDETGGVPDYC